MAVNETTQNIVCPDCGNTIGTARFETGGTDAHAPSHRIECPRCSHQWHLTLPGTILEIIVEPSQAD